MGRHAVTEQPACLQKYGTGSVRLLLLPMNVAPGDAWSAPMPNSVPELLTRGGPGWDLGRRRGGSLTHL